MSHYDLVIIGSGPAGEKAAAQAAYFGKRVAIIEKEPEPGGAMVHTGTLPSKTLREASLYLSGYRNREIYGVAVELTRDATLTALLNRKGVISSTEAGRMRANLERHNVDYINGTGRFRDTHTIVVLSEGAPDREITGDVILIATGSIPYHPDGVNFASDQIHDTDEILTVREIPESLTIIGAGVIGCEYACMFSALGTRVTLADKAAAILPFLDREIVASLSATMERMGIRFELNRSWESISEVDAEIATRFSDGGVLSSTHLLFAAGRNGQVAGLDLDAIGLEVNKRGQLSVDENFRTAIPHILAAGDVIGFPALASTAMEQGRVAVCHAFGFEYKQAVSGVLPFRIYTIPEVSAVGENEQSATQKGIAHICGRAFYRENVRGLIAGDTQGITKLVVERSTRKVIGVHVIGERASELVHIGQAALVVGATVDLFIDMVFNYPTLSEAYKYAAYDALAKLSSRD